MPMNLLLLAGALGYVAALLLPAYESSGFISFEGRGWKVLFFSMVLMAGGWLALAKGEGAKALICFLPGVVNLLVLTLLVLGFCQVHADATRFLAVVTLLSWAVLCVTMLLAVRGELRIGSYFWSAACVALAVHGLLA